MRVEILHKFGSCAIPVMAKKAFAYKTISCFKEINCAFQKLPNFYKEIDERSAL